VTEAAALFRRYSDTPWWEDRQIWPEPLNIEIKPWEAKKARQIFLGRYLQLTGDYSLFDNDPHQTVLIPGGIDTINGFAS